VFSSRTPRTRTPRTRTLRTHAAALAVCCVVASSAAFAEQRLWTFEVRELVEIAPLAHDIRLVPAPRGIEFPRTCKELVIHARFRAGQGVPLPYKRFFTEEGYSQAIRQLQEARVNDDLVKLGSLDRGFGRSEDASEECVVFSSGLAILMDPDQEPAIFSVF